MEGYQDYTTMYNLIKIKGMSQKAIAEYFGVGQDTISLWVKKHSLVKKPTKDRVIDLWKEYQDVHTVAENLGLKDCSVRYHLRKAGIDFVGERKLSPDDIREGVLSGLSFSAVAREHGVEVSYVSALAKKNGIKSMFGATPQADVDTDQMINYYNSGDSLNTIANRFRVSVPLVARRLRAAGCDIRTRGQQLSKIDDIGVVLRDFDSGLSINELAAKHSVHNNTIRRALMSAGVSFALKDVPQLRNKQWLERAYHSGSSALIIATKLDCTHGRVYNALRRFGIDRDNVYERASEFGLLDNAEALGLAYTTQSTATIANSLGCCCATVIHYLRKYNIKLRTHDEQIELMQKTISERYGWLYTGIANAKRSSAYYSKVGSTISLDSNLERKLADKLQADPAVVKFSRGKRIRVADFAGRECSYGPDFDVVYSSGAEEHIEVKPYKGLSAQPSQSTSRMYHQFWAGSRAYGDAFRVYDKSKMWSASEILDGMSDNDLFHAYNYADFFENGDVLARFLRQAGWRGLKYSKSDLADGLSRLLGCTISDNLENLDNSTSCSSLRLIYHFHDNLFSSWYSTYPSVASAFERLDLLTAACKRLYMSKRKRRIWLHPLLVELGKLGAPIVSQFKPRMAARIIAKYCRPGGLVFDPCAGWGARALGALRCCTGYEGLDINGDTNAGTREMLKYAKADFRITTMDCREEWPVDGVDMIFTSPPYDDTEYYYGYPEGYRPNTDSIVSSIFEQASRHLKDGVVVLNIPGWARDGALQHAGACGFVLVAEHTMRISQIMIKGEKYEPILVFARV